MRNAVLLLLALLSASASAQDRPQTARRVRTPPTAQLPVQRLPDTRDMYGKLDLDDPYRTVISGLFVQSVAVGATSREFHVYIGAKNRQSEPFVLLVADGHETVSDLLVKGGWRDLADAQGLIVAVATPAGRAWNVETDLPFLKALYTETHNRGYYNAQKGNNYLAAYGDGVTIAQMWAMAEPENFASIATFGPLGTIDRAYMQHSASAKSKLPAVSLGSLPMPAWMFVPALDERARAVVDYWNARNDVQAEKFSGDLVTGMYLPRTRGIGSLINEQNFLAQTRYTVVATATALDAARTAKVWAFMSSVTRPLGFANGALRAARSVEQWGATKKFLTVKGVTRYWLEFVPPQVFETTPGKVPLVVYFHGNNNTAESMLARSELIKVASDRGFIAIMLTGSLYNEANVFPNPRWNLNEEPSLFDDYAYVRSAIDDVTTRLPVDTSRIYAMGQSYGSMSTLAFSLRMNDVFAAGAGTGGALVDQFLGLYRSDKVLKGNLMPICVLIGSAEPGGGNLQNPGIRKNYPYWLERNGLPRDIDAALTGSYKAGRYNVYDFANPAGVPLVQYITVDERVHTIVPMDLYFQYDTFVAKWSRGADGTLYYLGKPVTRAASTR